MRKDIEHDSEVAGFGDWGAVSMDGARGCGGQREKTCVFGRGGSLKSEAFTGRKGDLRTTSQ